MRITLLTLSSVGADTEQGHIVTLEITSGEVYRGKLIEGARQFDLQLQSPC